MFFGQNRICTKCLSTRGTRYTNFLKFLEDKNWKVARLTSQANFGEVNAVGHHHESADAFGRRLLPRQVTSALVVLGRAAKRRYPASGLKVEARAGAHQIVRGRSVPEAKLLALLEDSERWRWVLNL